MNEKNWTADKLARMISGYLQEIVVGDIRFSVDLPESILESNGYWRVPIRPSYWPKRVYPLAEELALLEQEIQDKESVKLNLYLGEPLAQAA